MTPSLIVCLFALSAPPTAPQEAALSAPVRPAASTRPQKSRLDEPDDEAHLATRGAPLHARAATYFSENLREAELAHLARVAVWGGGNVMGGLALMGGTAGLTELDIPSQPELFGFGFQASLWGVINLGICAGGYFFLNSVTDDLREALDAEDTWRTVILVNEILDVGYILFGAALLAAGFLPIPLASQLRGHGLGIMFQGTGLLILDGLALLEAYERKEKADRFRAIPAHRDALGE